MKLGRSLIAGVLAAGLCLSPAAAAGSEFWDVTAGDWFYEGVQVCAQAGVMNGTGGGSFSPDGTMSLAQAAVIAARLGASFVGDTIPPGGEGAAWYAPELDYLRGKAPELAANVAAAPERAATRTEFFALLGAMTPKSELAAINSIAALPDTGDADVLAFYNAGILTGTDRYGTFSGERTLQRNEAAVTAARLIKPELRRQFVPQQRPAEQPAPESAGGVLTVNGVPVERSQVIACMNELVYYNDSNLYQAYGQRLDWNADYGLGDLKALFRSLAVDHAVRFALEDAKAEQLGCEPEDLPELLVPPPDRAALEDYAQQYDLLCAKHILVSDPDTAQAVLSGLKSSPTLEQFNALLAVYGTDPGMAANPDGYLFTAGEMVPAFESAVRSLEFGAYTTEPVQSEYGYHIIWRLDPAGHPELAESCRYDAYEVILDGWMEQAQVQITDQAALDALDPQACYEEFLAGLGGN